MFKVSVVFQLLFLLVQLEREWSSSSLVVIYPDAAEEGMFYAGHRCQVNLLWAVGSVKAAFLQQTMCLVSKCAGIVYMSRYIHFL